MYTSKGSDMLDDVALKVLDRISTEQLGHVDHEHTINFLTKQWQDNRDKLDAEHRALAETFDDSFAGKKRFMTHLPIGRIEENIAEVIERAKVHMGHSTVREDAFWVFKGNLSTILIGGLEVPMQKTELFEEFREVLQPFFRMVQDFYGYESLHAYSLVISELLPNKSVGIHKDIPLMFTHTHRCHWCLKADEGVEFRSRKRVMPISVGDVFELNNDRLYHEVVNNSNEARYHVILDCFDGKGEKGLVDVR